MLQLMQIPSDGNAPTPLKLVRGGANHLRFIIQAPEINPAAIVRRYAALTRQGQLLALESQNITVSATDGVLTVELPDFGLNSAEVQAFFAGQEPDAADNGAVPFYLAGLELGFFDSLTAAEAVLLMQIPVEIYSRQYLSSDFIPTPVTSYYNKTETDNRIAEMIADAVPVSKTEFANAVNNFAADYLEVLNGQSL